MKPAREPHHHPHVEQHRGLPPPDVEGELGGLVRAFGRLSAWRTPVGLLVGVLCLVLAALMTAHGFETRSQGEALFGMGGLAVIVVGTAVGVMYGPVVTIYRGGLVIRRRRGARAVRWSEVTELKLVLERRQGRRRQAVANVTMTLAGGGCEVLANMPSVEADAMVMLIERLSAPSLAAQLARELEAGHVAILGQLHLRERGWVVMNETVPWRDLESLDQADGVVMACFATAGLHEVGPYAELESAQGHLQLAIERARRDGARPELGPGLMLDERAVSADPATPLARLAPGRRAWRAARGAPLRLGL